MESTTVESLQNHLYHQRCNMIIESFKRNEENQVVAVCGDEEIVLSEEYIAEHKPQVGDTIEQ